MPKKSFIGFYLAHRPITTGYSRHSTTPHPITTSNKKRNLNKSWYLLRASSPSPTRPATTTATVTTTPRVAINRSTTTSSADGTFTPFLTCLNSYARLLAIPHINTDATLATLRGGKRGGNRTARRVDVAKLQECTCLAPNKIEIFDGSKSTD